MLWNKASLIYVEPVTLNLVVNILKLDNFLRFGLGTFHTFALFSSFP